MVGRFHVAKAEPEFAQAGKVFKTAANDAYDAYDYISGKIADAIDLLVPVAGEVNVGKALSKEAAAIEKRGEAGLGE